MIESRTIARPYARSAFEFAKSADTVDAWSTALARLAAIVSDPDARMMISHPRVTDGQLTEMLIDAGGGAFTGPVENFVRLLVDSGRVGLAPTIRSLFEELRAEAAGVSNVSVTSAFDLGQEQTDAVADALRSRFGRSVSVSVDTDPELLGGAVIRAGDKVIDLSVRGRVEGLRNQLTR